MSRPIHPILVHFPIALLVTSVAADAAFFFTSIESLRHAGWWMIAGAAAAAVATVAAGLFDMRRAGLDERVHERVHRHMWIGIALFLVICALAAWRWTFFANPDKPLTAVYLDMGFLAVALAAFQGWLGGELVFTYGVFVRREGSTEKQGADEAEASRPRKAKTGGQHSH